MLFRDFYVHVISREKLVKVLNAVGNIAPKKTAWQPRKNLYFLFLPRNFQVSSIYLCIPWNIHKFLMNYGSETLKILFYSLLTRT